MEDIKKTDNLETTEKTKILRHFHQDRIFLIDPTFSPTSSFRLLDLPKEVRLLIYDYVYGPDCNNVVPLIEIILYPSGRFHEPSAELTEPERDLSPEPDHALDIVTHFDKGLVNFQLANKQVYKEFNPVYYNHLLVKLESPTGTTEDACIGLEKLHEAFRPRVQRIVTNILLPQILDGLSGLRGVVVRNYAWDRIEQSAEELLSEFADEDEASKNYIDALVELKAKRGDQGISCWFMAEHMAYTPLTSAFGMAVFRYPRDFYATLIHYNTETGELKLANRPEAINRSLSSKYVSKAYNYEMSNFPTVKTSPFRHAPFDPKLAPNDTDCCPCQFYLLQMGLKLNVKVVTDEEDGGRRYLEGIQPEE